MIFFIMLAIVLWLGGYLMTVRGTSMTGVLSDDLEKVITPPKWLYYLCGVPVSKKYPKGQMRVVEFRAQIGGVFLGIYLIWYFITEPSYLINIMGFCLWVLTTFLITAYVSKFYATKRQSRIRKGKK